MKLNFNERHAFWDYGLGTIPSPIIPLTLIGRRNLRVDTFALLDSGADVCLFHAKWAKRIGLDLRSGRPGYIGGIGGGANVFYHRIRMKLGSLEIRSDVAFSDEVSDEISNQLIGRMDVFDRLRFALRQKAGYTYIGRNP